MYAHGFKVLKVCSNTHTNGLPDMYALVLGCAVPEDKCIDIRQCIFASVTTTFWRRICKLNLFCRFGDTYV